MRELRDLVPTLTDAVRVAFRDLAGIDAELRDARDTHEPVGAGICAVLAVSTGAGGGGFALAATEPAARALARHVLGDACPDPDAGIVRDCLGEVVNVIAGQAKTLLYGTPFHFTLGTPTVTDGAPELAARDRLRLTFASDLGEFALHVALPG